jgi:hypothetical protein
MRHWIIGLCGLTVIALLCVTAGILMIPPATVPPSPVKSFTSGSPTTPEPDIEPVTGETEEAGVYYTDCAEARHAGAAPLHRGEPGYRLKLDRDKDGVACS